MVHGGIRRVALVTLVVGTILGTQAVSNTAEGSVAVTSPLSGFTLAQGSGAYGSGQQVALPIRPGQSAQPGADWTFTLSNTFASGDVVEIAVTPATTANECTTNSSGADYVGFTNSAPTVAVTGGNGTDAAPAFTPQFAFSGSTFPPAASTASGTCAGVTNLLSLNLTGSATGASSDASWTIVLSGVQLSTGAGADHGYINVGVAYVPSGGSAVSSVTPTNASPPSNAIVGAMLPGFNSNVLARNDDGSTTQLALPFNLDFFGNTFSALYVNNNGNLTFQSSLSTYTPGSISGAGQPIIAPFWADVDTNPGGGVVTYGTGTIGGHQAFVANYPGVDCYDTTGGGLNFFQVVLIDRSDTNQAGQSGDNFDIQFNYDKVSWETGQASGGGSTCQGGSSARVGWSNGSSQTLELTGSGTNGAFLDGGPDSLVAGSLNSVTPGQYVFPVRNGGSVGNSVTGQVTSNPGAADVAGAFVSVCGTGTLASTCALAQSGSTGLFSVSGLPSAAAYSVTVFPPSGSPLGQASEGPFAVPCTGSQTMPDSTVVTCSAGTPNVPVVLTGPTPPPEGTTIEDNLRGTSGGLPVIYWQGTTQISTTGCPGGTGTGTITAENTQTGAMQTVPNPPAVFTETTPGSGTYVGTLPAPYPLHGPATINIVITCNEVPTTTTFNVYIDPSGVVVDGGGNPVAGATVTLLQLVNGNYTAVPNGSAVMSPANRTNPDTTGAAGQFGWDAVPGSYEVEAMSGSCSQTTAPFSLPPPVTGLVITLACLHSPAGSGPSGPSGPAVSGLSPSSGPATGGTTVTISGSNFSTASGATQVSFGSQPATSVACSSDTTCTAVAPASSLPGFVDVKVTSAGIPSTAVLADRYTYDPVVTALSPASGPTSGGTPVTITGAGFSTTAGSTTVGFGSNPASAVSCSSSTTCVATAPGAAAGTVDVIVTTLGLASAAGTPDQFSYVAPGATSSPTPSPTPGPTCTGATADGQYVCALYQFLLYRAPDPGGLAGFEALLSAGTTRAQVASDILASPEYRTNLVDGWFTTFLHRAADPGAVATFVPMLGHGSTDEAVVAQILGSPEFLADSGGTPGGYVGALYEVLLGRAADSAGLATFEGLLGTGTTRAQIASDILASPEYRSDLVEGWFITFLHRTADPGAVATFVPMLGGGATDEAVVAQILGSPEFLADVS